MRVRLTTLDGRVLVLDDVAQLLVEDDQGNPVSVAARTGVGNSFVVSSVDDDRRFNQVLRRLGLDRTVIGRPLRLLPSQRLPKMS